MTPLFLIRPMRAVDVGIVVIQEGDGISPWLLRLCERIAAEGYAVAAPDLFFRSGGPGASFELRAQGAAVQRGEALEDVSAAADALRSHGAARVGLLGFCMGGFFAWLAAREGDYDAAVCFYGPGIAGELGEPRCPTLLLFGGRDEWIPATDITAVAGHHHGTVVYDDAGHAFMRDGTDRHVADAADDAWSRMSLHFAEHLLVSRAA